MDSSGSSMSSLGAAEATQFLKDVLNVGKQFRNPNTSETSTASLASSLRDDMENTSIGNGEGRVHYSQGEVILTPYQGSAPKDSDAGLYSSGEIVPPQVNQASPRGGYTSPLAAYPPPDTLGSYPSPGTPSTGSYSSGHEADRSQSIHGDDGGGNDRLHGEENGQASLGEMLRNMNQQAITHQRIVLQGSDRSNSFSVYGRHVDIVASSASALDSSSPGSNKVKINPVVNFDWEHKHYVGNLVAVHRSGIHVAYVLRGKSGGIVRIINRKTAERALLRGFSGRVIDVSFAHISPIVIGAVDEVGNMFIYEILEGHEGKIDTTLLLSVVRPTSTAPSNYHRLIWCPYIPDDEEASGTTTNTTADSSGVIEDVGKLLVLTHGETAEMWNIDLVTREYGAGPMSSDDIDVGYLVIKSHSKPILDASFSPDGTALATASLDGEVKFFQVYMHDKAPPRCLHEWKPHDGHPVSSLFFLDDHKHPNPEIQFWKFAVTGASQNMELKVWSCESWVCLQTIRLLPSPDTPIEPCIKAHMDLSANYLVLSDIQRKVVYVLQIHQDMSHNRAHVSSVSEFLLTQPCLSFAVLDAARRRFRRDIDQHEDNMDELTTGEVPTDEEQEVGKNIEGANIGVLVKLYSVHTRALQELQIRYRPQSSVLDHTAPSSSTLSHDESGLRDQLSDLSLDTSDVDFSHQVAPGDKSQQVKTAVQSLVSSDVSPHIEDIVETSSSVGDVSPAQNTSSVSDASERAAEQARAQAEAHLKDLIQGSYTGSQGGYTGSPRTPNIGTQRPLLMTPDAFISSKRDAGGAVDSVRSSGSSSFTQVTAMDDELRTPHASVSHNQPSPGSSITLTPASSRDMSAGGSPHLTTPTSLPLPPVTPGEDAALSDPKLSSPPKHASAPTSHEFYTSSPASHHPHHFHPPSADSENEESSRSRSETEEGPRMRRAALHSTGSSSSTSLEVLEILEGARRPGGDICEEESDGAGDTPTAETQGFVQDKERLAAPQDILDPQAQDLLSTQPEDLLGAVEPGYNPAVLTPERVDSSYESNTPHRADNGEESYTRAANGGQKPYMHGTDDTYNTNSQGYHATEEHRDSSYEHSHVMDYSAAPEHVDEAFDPHLLPSTPPSADNQPQPVSPSKYDERIWPTPPDVNLEAQRLAAEAIQRAAKIQQDGSQGEDEGEDEDVVVEEDEEEEEGVQRDGDVHIEEEKEEIIEEVDDSDGGGEIIIHTHEMSSAKRSSPQPSAIHIPSLQELTDAIQSMVSMLQIQQQEIEQLRSEIRVQRHVSDTVTALQAHIAQLESGLASRLAGALNQHSQSETERLQQALGERETQERVKQDQLVASLTQTLGPALVSQVDRSVRDEIHSTVVPAVTQLLDPVKHQLHSEISQKLTATDVLMKENINKLVRSRQSIEAIGAAAGNTMQGPIQAACRDVLVPAFDRACQNMCQQVNQTFQRGTQEYMQQLSTHFESVRRRHDEARDPIVHQLQAMVDAFKRSGETNDATCQQLIAKVSESVASCTTSIQNSQAEVDSKLTTTLSSHQEALVSRLQRLLEDQVMTTLREQQATISDQLVTTVVATMRSQAPTPVPTTTQSLVGGPPDPQQLQTHILQLLRQGQLNTAFQQALSASDLKLVMFVCETVDPSKVFSQTPVPLQQPVLLSLIQQLSADLNNNLELKHRYLEEAVMNLDQHDAVTREHLPAVIGQLCQKLSTFIQANPHDRMTRQVRMLLMGAQSLLK